jgi:hypothetical protein
LATAQIAVASVLGVRGIRTRRRSRLRPALPALSPRRGDRLERHRLRLESALFVPIAFGSHAAVPGRVLGKTLATALTAGARSWRRKTARRVVWRVMRP